jgi:hypothetical protein
MEADMSLIRQNQYQIDQERRNDLLREAQREALAAETRAVPMPKEIALRLCQGIRQQHAGQWYSPRKWMCALCSRMARDGAPARLIPSCPGYYGCSAVKKRYLELYAGDAARA